MTGLQLLSKLVHQNTITSLYFKLASLGTCAVHILLFLLYQFMLPDMALVRIY